MSRQKHNKVPSPTGPNAAALGATRPAALQILKALAPGFLPLIIYVVVSELWGDLPGLIVGVGIGLVEFFVILIRQRKVDGFSLLDTGLLVVLGLISFGLNDDVFFRLKPAVLETVLVVLLGFAVFADPAIVLGSALRGFERAGLRPDMAQMRSMLKVLLVAVGIHTVLCYIAAFYMNKEAWGFVTTILLYLIVIPCLFVQVFVTIVGRGRAARVGAGVEYLPIIDEGGKVLSRASREEAHSKPGMLHPVVRLLVLDGKGSILLQKRALSKKQDPGLWDSSAAGHVSFGEDIEKALIREAGEEIGLRLEKAPAFLARYRQDAEQGYDSELAFVFVCVHEGPFSPDPGEVAELRFWPLADLARLASGPEFSSCLRRDLELLAGRAKS